MVDKSVVVKKLITSMDEVGGQLTSKAFAQLAIRLLLQSLKDTIPSVRLIDVGDTITVDPTIRDMSDKQVSDLMNTMITKLGLKFYTKKIGTTLDADEQAYIKSLGIEL